MNPITVCAVAALFAGGVPAGGSVGLPVPDREAVQHLDAEVASNEVARLIEDHYFDAESGAEIARDLRTHMAGLPRGDVDPLTWAAEMTRFLAPLDGHFRVEWSEPTSEAVSSNRPIAAAPRISFESQLARHGYGFEKVEVLPGNVGLIEMSNFAPIDFADAADPARAAAEGALALVAGADTVIFDLRRNGGGAPSMAGYLVSAFVEPDADVYNTFSTRTGNFSERPEETFARPMIETPVYVLLSRRSGSAAEAFPYTLQAAGRAVVVGEPSAGAANPGSEYETPSGFTVFISTGAPINPFTNGNWEGEGVQPDIPVNADEALETAYHAALERTARVQVDAAWALEALDIGEVAMSPAGLTGRYGDWVVIQRGEDFLIERARRGAERLRPLSPTLFYVEGRPSVRYRFNTDGDRAHSVDRLSAYGAVSRMVRSDD